MNDIGGNMTATIQVKSFVLDENGKYKRNEIGEVEKTWTDAQSIRGLLDLAGGDSRYTPYSAKIQESTHVFIADYAALDERISAENARMVIGGKAYDIMLIDNPMELCDHLEIFLKYTGGQ